MPAEWEEHERTWMIWPTREEAWLYASSRAEYEAVLRAFQKVVRAVQSFEPVTIIGPAGAKKEAERSLGIEVGWLDFEADDAWARDVAPTFVFAEERRVVGVNWTFNGWGGAFEPYARDAALAEAVLHSLGMECMNSGLIAEGGALHVNGQGLGVATEATLLHPGRNGLAGKALVEKEFEKLLGVESLLWIPKGIVGDDTGGHIDVVAAFLDRDTIALASPGSGRPDWEEGYREARLAIDAFGEQTGARLDLLDFPLPDCPGSGDSPFSYLNFYFVNGGIVYPNFGCKEDPWVEGLLRDFFPQRQLVPVEATPLYCGGGGIHCLTQQEPRAPSAIRTGVIERD